MAVRRKAMYGLSSLIRLFLNGQREFLKLNGLEMFVKFFEEGGSGPLVVKVITLMTDLLTEQIEHVTTLLKKQGEDVSGDISGRYSKFYSKAKNLLKGNNYSIVMPRSALAVLQIESRRAAMFKIVLKFNPKRTSKYSLQGKKNVKDV